MPAYSPTSSYAIVLPQHFCGRQRPLISSVRHPLFTSERVEIRVDLSLSTYWVDEIGNMGDWAETFTPSTAAKGLRISEEIALRVALELRNVNNKKISESLLTLQNVFRRFSTVGAHSGTVRLSIAV